MGKEGTIIQISNRGTKIKTFTYKQPRLQTQLKSTTHDKQDVFGLMEAFYQSRESAFKLEMGEVNY